MIFLGADHGGFARKEAIKSWLTQRGYTFEDLGAQQLRDDDDYPAYAFSVAKKVAEDPETNIGILICKSGGGMAIAANRVPNVRAVDCLNKEEVVHARRDNNANVLTLSALWLDENNTIELVKTWLETPFSNEERHKRRIRLLEAQV